MTLDDPTLDAMLRAYVVPPPAADASLRVLLAAAPLLAGYAARPDWARVRRAVTVALLALPSVLLFDAWLLQALYRVLGSVLSPGLSLWLTTQYALGLLFLLGGTFVVIPVVAGHAPARVEATHD